METNPFNSGAVSFDPAVGFSKALMDAKWKAGRIAEHLRAGRWTPEYAHADVMKGRYGKPVLVGVICGCVVGALVESGHAELAEQFLIGMARHSDSREE